MKDTGSQKKPTGLVKSQVLPFLRLYFSFFPSICVLLLTSYKLASSMYFPGEVAKEENLPGPADLLCPFLSGQPSLWLNSQPMN